MVFNKLSFKLLLNPKAMRAINLLNITLIVLAAIVAADTILTIYNPVKSDYTNLIVPVTVLSALFLIRTIYASRQKTLDQFSSVRVNKL